MTRWQVDYEAPSLARDTIRELGCHQLEVPVRHEHGTRIKLHEAAYHEGVQVFPEKRVILTRRQFHSLLHFPFPPSLSPASAPGFGALLHDRRRRDLCPTDLTLRVPRLGESRRVAAASAGGRPTPPC